MNVIKSIIYPSLLASALLFSIISCKEDKLVFPQQVEGEDGSSSTSGGPVKQNNLTIITDSDEVVRFELGSVDRERVKALIFSVNQQGESLETEVTNFDAVYLISNLSLDENTEVKVRALGLDGKESKSYSYFVKPQPFPAKSIAKTVLVRNEGFSGILNISNSTKLNAKLYYKLDNSTDFVMFDLPTGSISKEIIFAKQSIGQHKVEFYVEDELGNRSTTSLLYFEIYEPSVVLFTTTVQKAGWTPWASNGYDPGFSAERAIDGTIAENGGYEFVTESSNNPNTYKISFTKTRITSDGKYRSEAAKNPQGEHSLLVVKSVTLYSGSVGWGVNPSIAHVYGYLEDNTIVNLGTFSSPTIVTLGNPFVIDLSSNTLPLKAIRFDVVNSLTNPTAVGMNLNEINLSGYFF